MKKSMKKVVAGVLTVAMAAGLMAGCGSNSASTNNGGTDSAAGTATESAKASGDVPVVNLCVPNVYDITDLAQIQDAINGITTDKYGVQINLTYVEIGNWVNQSNMLLTGDEADIIMVFGTPLLTYVKNGQLQNLDDYYANASDTFKTETAKIFTADDLACTSVGGSIYALPNYRNHGDTVVLDIDESVADELGGVQGEYMTLDEVDTL